MVYIFPFQQKKFEASAPNLFQLFVVLFVVQLSHQASA
ncbi:hypothetical protein G134_1942 [Lactobacillus delbrueckii subsp. lactis CRL581]|nr:hypothetical protein G134_1942 [Lactobacillus delbrueckii subsp. lactis CRL581]